MIETDNLSVAKELKVVTPPRSHAFGTITDILQALSSFESWSIKWVNRERNILAHKLAALASVDGDREIIADVPSSLRTLVCSDCNSRT